MLQYAGLTLLTQRASEAVRRARALRARPPASEGLLKRYRSHVFTYFEYCLRGRALTLEISSQAIGKGVCPAHSHALQAYPRLDFEFLATLAAVVLNRQERHPRWLR